MTTVTTDPAVLLISPGILKWTDMDFGLPHMVSLGGYLKHHTGVRVELLDLNYEGGDHHQLLRTIEALGPFLMVGVSCYSSFDYRRVMALAAFLKKALPDVPLVTGGYHASALPGDVVFEGSPFTSVVQGEAEAPMRQMVEVLLGGGQLEPRYGPAVVAELDDLPPTDWSLLDRYWPRATTLGRKFQIYLSRGCPYRCTFCMERSKSGYAWRAHSPERAVDELARLARKTDLSQWVVNIADPLFGFRRDWRRQVLMGIVEKGLLPRAYWTLTRSDDLDEPDFELLGRARFSIGIGLESGSPSMLRRMQKGNTPERYLGQVKRLADRSHAHGITWAVNVIVGHPGETRESMGETAGFIRELFSVHDTTRGWLSIDPFRLYPGSAVATSRAQWERDTGAVFYSPEWWKGWYDHAFHAQHLDPSGALSYAERVRFMHETYAPIVADIGRRFVGQGREVDAVYRNSIRGQLDALSEERRDHDLRMGEQGRHVTGGGSGLTVPLGLRMKDPWTRRREAAIRRLLDRGVLRSEDLVEALLQEGPERWMSEEEAEAVLDERAVPRAAEGLPPRALGLSTVAMGLEALEPEAGMTAVDLAAGSGWVAALLSRLVGPEGRVLAHHLPEDGVGLGDLPGNVQRVERTLDRLMGFEERVDRIWLGAALPRAPRHFAKALKPGGRAVTLVGPRFRAQRLVRLVPDGDGGLDKQELARVTAPVLAGPGGWMAAPVFPERERRVRFGRRLAPALAYHVLGFLDLGADAANLHTPRDTTPAWVDGLAAAYAAAPGRLVLHGAALAYDDVDAWLEALAEHPALADAAGQALFAVFAAAVAAERPAFEAAWSERADAVQHAERRLGAALERLRERLYQQQGAPPPLLVLDCPALGGRGRATTAGGTRLVATSLSEDEGHVLLQLLHEEMHAITDPIVRAEHDGTAPRDTRKGSAGWGLHVALEATAVGATDAFLKARAPELLHDFGRWRARVGA